MTLLTDRYAAQLAGVVSCYDRIVIMGTPPGVCYAEGMAAYLRGHDIRLFDYPRFAEPLHEEIWQNTERLAREHGLEIEFIRSAHVVRAEDRIRAILDTRGDHHLRGDGGYHLISMTIMHAIGAHHSCRHANGCRNRLNTVDGALTPSRRHCIPIRCATIVDGCRVRQFASRTRAIDHADRVAGIAERTTALAEMSSVSCTSA